MKTGRTKLSAACALLAFAMLLVIAPSSAAEPTPPAAAPALTAERAAEFSAKLGELLHNLDQDQSRRLTRIGKATTRYKPATLGQTADLIARHQDQVLVIFAQRRRAGQTRLDLENALLLPADGPAVLSAKARTRDAYVFNGPLDGTWNTLVARLGSSETTNTTRALGFDALAKTRFAAFVFLLRTDAAGQRTAQKLILVPDTIRISIAGDGVAGSGFGDADAGATSEEPYYDEAESVVPEYELPEPIEPGPIEQSPEE